MNRVALLHYWLTNMRGGENVLAELCRMFPEADIFTHAFNPEKVDGVFSRHSVYESIVAKMPGARNGCQRYLPLMPYALRKLDLSPYDLLISSESGPIKGVRKPAKATHICYCHTPMRYLWDMYADYYRAAGLISKLAMRMCKGYLRRYDLDSVRQVDVFVANSRFVAERIKRIYDREAQVVYPPVDTDFYASGPRATGDYYLLAGTLIDYKRPELAIAACQRLGRKLIVAGDGELRRKLEQNAGGDIQFYGRVSNEELRRLYAEARALIFPGIEDFGIIPLEAQAAGTPVIAFGAGGALETVREGETGLFFSSAEVDCLCEAIERFEARTWGEQPCRENARRFSRNRFQAEFMNVVHRSGLA